MAQKIEDAPIDNPFPIPKRYKVVIDVAAIEEDFYEHPEGEWVRWEDIKHLFFTSSSQPYWYTSNII